MGDVTDRVNLTPVALMEGGAFAKTVFGDEPTKPDYRYVGYPYQEYLSYIACLRECLLLLYSVHLSCIFLAVNGYLCCISLENFVTWSHPNV